jgi:signal transduction histidine kinase/DNA-binding response OmpR family regulator
LHHRPTSNSTSVSPPALRGADKAAFQKQFDELTALAAEICQMPAAVVHVGDAQGFTVKSSGGAPIASIQFEPAFFAAIADGQPLIVSDAAADPRLGDKPLVTGPSGIRFFAAVPLMRNEGTILGTLSILDFHPRTISASQIRWLESIARQLVFLSDSSRAAVELEAARRAAEAAAVAKSAFLANISHEIRTPMSAIAGYTDLMLDPNQADDDRRDCLQIIRRNGRQLLELIDDVLDLARLESGRLTVEKGECDLARVLADMASLMMPRAAAKDLVLKTELIQPRQIPRHFRTDSLRLKQILVNLVGNAIKFTDHGQVTLRVSHQYSPENRGEMKFEVIDTGIGMTESQMAGLFQPFTQGDTSSTRRYAGTGLGLTLSSRLAHMLSGDISVQSAAGIGSSFMLTIDSGSCEEHRGVCDTFIVESAKIDDVHYPHHLPRLDAKILLADDGLDNQRLIRQILVRAGAEVVIANNGRDAVGLAMQGSFDAILMDMQMPVLDGYGATSELRQNGFSKPIIALTANNGEDREKCQLAGCDDYLSKPVERLLLLQTLTTHINGIKAYRPAYVAPPPRVQADGDAPLVSAYAGDPEMVEAIREFIDELPRQVTQLQKSLDESDLEKLQTLVHQLKGAGGGYGFDIVTQLAQVAEHAIRSGETLGGVRPHIERLANTLRLIDGYPKEDQAIR